MKLLHGKCEITSCCGIPVGEIVVGDVVGFVVGLTLLGFMAKHTTYGFGEKVWKPGIRKVRQEWRGQEIRKETFSFDFVKGKPGYVKKCVTYFKVVLY